MLRPLGNKLPSEIELDTDPAVEEIAKLALIVQQIVIADEYCWVG